MERRVEAEKPLLPFFQQFVDQGKRESIIRLLGRAGIAFSEQDRARILACTDGTTLDRWIDNVLGAKTVGEVLT